MVRDSWFDRWTSAWRPSADAKRTAGRGLTLAGIGLLLGGGTGLVLSRTWTATISFTGQSGEAVSTRIAGLAAQFGVAVPTSDRSQSPEYFADLVKSGRVLGSIAAERVPVMGDTARVPIARLLKVDTADGSHATRERVIRELDKLVRISTGLRTGVVRVTVRMPDPEAAVYVASTLVAQANAVAVLMRQQQASVERAYAEGQVRELERRLTLAEDSLLRFSRANREYIDESVLSLTRARLARSVELQRSVLTSVTQSVEQSRLAAVRDTPNLTVVDPARLPERPDGRGTLLYGLVGLVAGIVTTLAITAFGRRNQVDGRSPRSSGSASS